MLDQAIAVSPPEPAAPHGNGKKLGRGGRGGWTAVAAVASVSFVLVLSEFLPVALLPGISTSLDVRTGTAGLLTVVPGLTAAVAAPLLTAAASRFDRRRVLLVLAALIAISDASAALAPDLPFMIAARLLLGLAVGGFWAMGAGIGSRLVPTAATRATALITAGISAGTVVSLPLGALIGQLAGWRTAFLTAAGAATVTLLMLYAVLPVLKSARQARTASVGTALRNPRLVLALLATAITFLGQFTAYTYITPYLRQHAHLGPTAVTLVLLLYGLAGLSGNFTAGVLARRRLGLTVKISTLLLAGSLLLLPIATTTAAVIGLVMVWGAAFGAVPLLSQTRVVALYPKEPEAPLALLVTGSQTFLAAGSFFGGILTDHYGAGTAFACGAVVVAVSVLVPQRRLRAQG